jgi:rRNA processing protein Krr1/Pno1
MLSSDSTDSAIELEENKRKCAESSDDRCVETKRQAFDISSKMPYMEVSPEDCALESKRQQPFESSAKGAYTEAIATAEAITITMECPATAVGSIIGKKGANVNEINSRSGCKVVIDQRDGIPARVNLTGPPDRLAIAMSLVSLIIKDGANALFGGDSEDSAASKNSLNLTSESRCAAVKVGTIIGHKGVTIAEIARRSKCKVHIIQDPPSDGNVNERQVIYSGTLEQIQEAKVLVQSVIDEGAGALGLPSLPPNDSANTYNKNQPQYPLKNGSPVVVEEEDIDPEKVKNVIGAKGCIISEIMRRSGCKIIINQQPKEQTHKVVYTGEKGSNADASMMLFA